MRNKYDTPCCPLCKSEGCALVFKDEKRHYWRCSHCDLIYVPSQFWLSAEEEKATYDLHSNSPKDEGYRHFLSRLSRPLIERLPPKQKGLDFGCGPGPTLSVIFEEHGHQMDLYDPFYFDRPSVFSNNYDFICATEVLEHLRDPHDVFMDLFKMLRPGGYLGMMTKRVTDINAFRRWHYIRDMTHICFYSRATFEYIAKCYAAQLDVISSDVILLNYIC